MPFSKNDPNINRKGRARLGESMAERLVAALDKREEIEGMSFPDKVAEFAFKNKEVMIAVLKKFVPDIEKHEHKGIEFGNYVIIRNETGKTNIPDLSAGRVHLQHE